MKESVLVLGAGKSSKALIDYLLEHLPDAYRLLVADIDLSAAQKRIDDHRKGEAIQIHQDDKQQLKTIIAKSKVVISMLPAQMHDKVAELCLDENTHLLTASYCSPAIKALDEEVKKRNLIFLVECGLDPGIDHMSAMKTMHEIKSKGAKIIGFETFTGGLLAPGQEVNPWGYKFTWNPRNVVISEQGVVKFIQEGRYKYIPYHRVFRRTEVIEIPEYGTFEGYANRDSLKYREIYGLKEIPTIYRGTLRRPGFCKSWDVFVQLGVTDDTYQVEGVEKMTHRDFINSFLFYHPTDSVELKLAHYMRLDLDSIEMRNLEWLDIFKDIPVGLKAGTPAQILQHILEKKWTVQPHEKDMIIMWHKFDFLLKGEKRQMQSALAFRGKGGEDTAMSNTVGLPLAIATLFILDGKFKSRGVLIPVLPEIYESILEKLSEFGMHLQEWEVDKSF